MDEEMYNGIPVRLLPINEVDWQHRGDYIRTRTQRKGAEEFDVEAEWAHRGRDGPASRDPP